MFARKRRGDFDDDDGYRDFRPRMQKRQRVPPVVQLCKEMMPDIRTIGESIKSFDEDIQFLSEAIINEYGHEEYFNTALLNTFNSIVMEQPQKQPAIALLTLVVNNKNPIAGKSIVNFFYNELQKWCNESYNENFNVTSNETGPWNRVKLILRFLSLMSPILIIDDLINIYKSLIDFSIELNNIDPSKRNPLSEAIYTNTLMNIPYLFYFNRSNELLKNKVEEFIIMVESSYNLKIIKIDLLNEYTKSFAPYEPIELVQIVLNNVKKSLSNDMEQLNQLFINWPHLLPEKIDNNDDSDGNADTNEHGFNDPLILPTIEQVTPFMGLDRGFGSVDGMWKTPRYDFHVYLPNSVGEFETVLPITTFAGQLFNDIIIDIVQSMEFNRKEVARQVVTLDLFFKNGIFAEPGIPIAQLVDKFEEDPLTSTYKLEDIAIETILSLMFKLPTVSQPFAYFYTLLVEICQNSPKAIAPVFGRAFRFFYNNLDNIDFELRSRYLDWFSIQMSNFSFSWKWNEWENDSIKFGKLFYSPKMSFAKNLIRKELRLTSNTLDVEESLPEEFKQYLDSSYISHDELVQYYQSFFNDFKVEPSDVKKHDLYFKQDSLPFAELTRRLIDFMHKNGEEKKIEELESIVEEFKENYGTMFTNFDKFIVTIIVQCLAHSGSRSLSHANKYINDLADDIKHIFNKLEIEDDIKQFTAIEAIVRFWNSNSQTGFLITDAFKYAEIISSKSIFEFCFFEKDNRNYGLVDSTVIEAIFRNLSQDPLITTGNPANFEFVFEKLCVIINDTINKLGVNAIENVVAPIITEDTIFNDEQELVKLDLIWKYQTAVGFCKSLLRKYSDEYRLLNEKLSTGLPAAIPHEPTRDVLISWVSETNEI
ncbi:hypothetical protein Kpol_1025p11 [Vanderwaltozyma polyspora DSM 70294]|uniref:Nuclear cap-binding protein complex subunit 1 n=1 Tax=Vanderwaltozyma polyspora (strain ATCC 22028 / DSM 70294 / BCRC 21397 / CBS 2163 / NBRC 10782 / NRRL Y-8283 / UCD 57-17) TaxID=436907 RepID=A7TKT7_VANPO|nr:uncharacterized protein Kpol_1025p11 [Vanderwaltozyma polyspora DSM 70294]EDO17092.1 hypothetical protein Kpol_1025p11 [Vanderwaltozyma polyspora DSM 70294]